MNLPDYPCSARFCELTGALFSSPVFLKAAVCLEIRYTVPYIFFGGGSVKNAKNTMWLSSTLSYFLQMLEPNVQRLSKLTPAQFCVVALEIRASRRGPKCEARQWKVFFERANPKDLQELQCDTMADYFLLFGNTISVWRGGGPKVGYSLSVV